MTHAARPSTTDDAKSTEQKDNEDKMKTEYADTETDPEEGEDWAGF